MCKVFLYCFIWSFILLHKDIDGEIISESRFTNTTYPFVKIKHRNASVENLKPYFDINLSKNITAIAGKTAVLRCRIKNLFNHTVSWLRHRDLNLLTVGTATFTPDKRFRATIRAQTDDWFLFLDRTKKYDTGIYECQISTIPPLSYSLFLTVIEPSTSILSGSDVFINTGSTINITCMLKNSPDPSPKIFWKHNSQIIGFNKSNIDTNFMHKNGMFLSVLLIENANSKDSGNYTCQPENANSKTVVIHVLNGKLPAAMQHGGQFHTEHYTKLIWFFTMFVSVYCCFFQF